MGCGKCNSAKKEFLKKIAENQERIQAVITRNERIRKRNERIRKRNEIALLKIKKDMEKDDD